MGAPASDRGWTRGRRPRLSLEQQRDADARDDPDRDGLKGLGIAAMPGESAIVAIPIGETAAALGTAEALPWADDSLDMVTCQTLLIHVPHLQNAVREMTRVLVTDAVRDLADR